MPAYRASLAAAFAEAGRPEESRAELERLVARDLAAVPRDFTWSVSLATLALVCHHLGDTTAQELGIHGLGDRAGVLLGELAAPPWPAGLSGREVEVLRLIATGHSNRAIAQALYISPNTVLRHVSNIFTKTGVANRAEAAAYATRHGLTR
jgi:DNA-binding CsgD family transcriptional regulator